MPLGPRNGSSQAVGLFHPDSRAMFVLLLVLAGSRRGLRLPSGRIATCLGHPAAPKFSAQGPEPTAIIANKALAGIHLTAADLPGEVGQSVSDDSGSAAHQRPPH